jgi:hypothetical protein
MVVPKALNYFPSNASTLTQATFPFTAPSPPSTQAPTQLPTINGPKMNNCGNPVPNSGSTAKLPGYKIALRPVIQYKLPNIAVVNISSFELVEWWEKYIVVSQG